MHPPSYSSCPRKFDITRILRFKITMFNAKVDTNWGWKTFAKFASFDDGEMTGGPGSPFSWSKDRENSVGCLRLDQHSKYFGDWYEGSTPATERGGVNSVREVSAKSSSHTAVRGVSTSCHECATQSLGSARRHVAQAGRAMAYGMPQSSSQ